MGGFLVLALALAGTPPEAPGPTPDDERKVAAEVDTVFQAFDATASPGCALAVARDGRVVYRRAYGMADLDHDVPIRRRTHCGRRERTRSASPTSRSRCGSRPTEAGPR